MQDLSARGVGLCGGSVARFGITRENPLGGPRYAANPNTLWISCVCPTEVLLPDGKWVRDEDDDVFAIMIHR